MLKESDILAFKSSWGNLAGKVFDTCVTNGFWEQGAHRNKGEMIALMHTELSEALEAIRKNNPPDKHLQNRDSVSVELADAVIRIMDYGAGWGLDIPGAIVDKIMFNITRPFKHGKGF